MDAFTTPLPKTWQKVRLGDIGKPCMCKRVMKHQTTPYGEIPFYKIGTFGNTADAFISKKLFLEYKTKYSFPKKGDILISASGTIGRAVIYDGKPAYFQDSNIVWIDNDETLVKNDFLFYAYSNIKWNTEHTTILRLYNDNFRNTLIPLPPLNEQIAIANVLSDVDRYLYSLDALILKKESVKKALSFELLSQRKRLKGFNQAWQKVRLGDICEFGNGGAYETLIVENGNFKLISLNSIDIDGNLKNTMKRVNFYDNSLKQDDIVMVLSDVAHGDFLGLCAVIPNNDYVLNQRMGRLRKKNDCINILFLRLYINANQKYFKMQGQGSSQLNLSKKAIEDFEILLPPLDEQAAIANVLSALDNEIISLKNKKRQFENIKKALNHDLMSAKIRVLNK
ncbi:restriction endonuclease subunit S [Helicobacter pylori]|uniref:Type I restriction modification DNA specificity domain protein n=1 Tax=Helicobacter pylori HP260AFii TaxID=1159077 RepID=A0ABC9SBA2_HELPX|nr:restriction endonuclease subunit S [Helicobacter pylori]EMH20749.1 type I restriction modification DNA specificity domain protein [Helicobacter pylori GAM260ASi]EMH28819.1 type I restriction modification DNA specificity domain protein [Helicobacter pylori GAM268Bii]EMH65383.1 type I restriction modification DNA specificity domain protein [Helicobacter pylori HP260AFi]EMH67275.1 type I restriction modification DNA specificity domain protein [Helicobacter pylori HP260ASii]EMH68485.1 type I re